MPPPDPAGHAGAAAHRLEERALSGGALDLKLVETLEEANELKRWMGERRELLAVDTETGGLDWWRDALRTVQVGDGATGWCVPVEGRGWGGLVEELLREYEGPVAMQNQSFDVKYLERNGYPVRRRKVHDTKVMAKCLDPVGPAGLKPLADRYLGGGSGSQQELRDLMAQNRWTWATVPVHLPQYWQYAALDTVLTARLAETLWPRVQAYRDVYDLEIAAQHVLTDMEVRGIRVDLDYCRTMKDAWQTELAELERRGREEWGVANVHANEQVYRRLSADGVALVKLTPTGKPALTEDVLLGLQHPLAPLVLRARHLKKVVGAYLDNFLDFADGDRLHPSVNALGARTGRMSITRPALQTLERGREIRDALVPSEGNRLLTCDFAGIEMRLLAHFSGDQNMVDAYLRGEDLHDYAAGLIFGPAYTKPQRQTAKTTGFTKIFGGGTNKVAQAAGISLEQAEAVTTAWDAAFPAVRPFMQRAIDVLHERARERGAGYVTTPLGRLEPCDPREAYKVINYLIQGTAADVFKQALVRLDDAGLTRYLVLVVHDEVVLDVPAEETEAGWSALAHEVEMTMAEPSAFRVPLTAEASEPYVRYGDKYAE